MCWSSAEIVTDPVQRIDAIVDATERGWTKNDCYVMFRYVMFRWSSAEIVTEPSSTYGCHRSMPPREAGPKRLLAAFSDSTQKQREGLE
jgi:hypothetical protein